MVAAPLTAGSGLAQNLPKLAQPLTRLGLFFGPPPYSSPDVAVNPANYFGGPSCQMLISILYLLHHTTGA
jgi:hypothetical protein